MNLAPSWYLPTKSTTSDSMVIIARLENIDFWNFRAPGNPYLWEGGRGIGRGAMEIASVFIIHSGSTWRMTIKLFWMLRRHCNSMFQQFILGAAFQTCTHSSLKIDTGATYSPPGLPPPDPRGGGGNFWAFLVLFLYIFDLRGYFKWIPFDLRSWSHPEKFKLVIFLILAGFWLPWWSWKHPWWSWIIWEWFLNIFPKRLL